MIKKPYVKPRRLCDEEKQQISELELKLGIVKSDYADLKAHYNELDAELREVNSENINLRIGLIEAESDYDDAVTAYRWYLVFAIGISLAIGYTISGVILL
jgi:chromosome segregation ATPase